ncbi:MAG: hypothetical protein IKH88_04180 [Prevotella sp.]|nr:hypothetical protein [Prevotella sp.]
MKKNAILTVLLLFCAYLQLHADDYKILQMNTNSVKIGTVLCHQGDTFSENEQIFWSDEKQAIKAMNTRTKEVRVFAAKAFKNYKARSVKDYYLKNNHLSTRGGMVSFSDLEEELSDTIYLYDVVSIESPIPIDSLSSYVISYGHEKKKWRTLMSTDEYFYLCRELFENNEEIKEFKISLYFRNKNIDEDYLITDDLIVVLLPLMIDP